MSQNFQPGDFLIFQLESGYALLRLLALDETNGGKVWHIAAYVNFFPDVESAEIEIGNFDKLKVSSPHIALNNRAFESTQVARIANVPLTEFELAPLDDWRDDPSHQVSDRSVRLMLGLR